MLNKILNKFNHLKNILLGKLHIYRVFKINDYSIQISYLHKLQDLQRNYPYYDKFLNHFVKYLPNGSIVVDVGANVGDTLLSMVSSNSKLEYLCIEPDDEFYFDLEKNIQILKKQNNKLTIKAVKELVGLEINNVSLSGSNSSKHAEPGKGLIKSKKLSTIFDELSLKSSRLSLLKTDVDGFDWDVINSSYDLLDSCPYLYFECFHNNEYQLNNYKKLFQNLKIKGYENFLFFDNFGKKILTVNEIKIVNELLEYTKKSHKQKSANAIVYYDILAYNNNVCNLIEEIINEYNQVINFKN